jgi:hypothetical protein
MRPGPSAYTLSSVLNVGAVTTPAETVLTGGASLLVRGLLEFSDASTLELSEAINPIALILTSATRWTVFASRAQEKTDSGVLVESPDGILMAHPGGLGTWWFILIDPRAAIEKVVSETAMQFARASDPIALIVRTSTFDDERTFNIARTGDDWTFAAGPANAPAPEISIAHTTADEVGEHLSGFIATWPAPLER